MELDIYDSEMTLHGVIEEIESLIWTRRYWAAGEFKLLVPFTDRHVSLLQKGRLIMKRGDNEAGEIRYVKIKKNSQGMEEIEAQGKFLTGWLADRIVRDQIIATDNTQNILYRIVDENAVAPAAAEKTIPRLSVDFSPDLGSGSVQYSSEPFINALLACEMAAKSAKLGFKIYTDIPAKKHCFLVYKGKDLTADNIGGNAPCIFSHEFDNVIEQEFINSVENMKTTAYVGGEEMEGVPRKVVEVGAAEGLERKEVFINASDITQTYKNSQGQDVTMPDAQYINMLAERGTQELAYYTETLAFSSKINTRANLRYKRDYDLGDRVTCLNKRWGIKINVRITEITEIYERYGEEIEITFGESLPALIDRIRQIAK